MFIGWDSTLRLHHLGHRSLMHLEAFFPWVAFSLLYYIIIKTKLHLEKQNAGHFVMHYSWPEFVLPIDSVICETQ